MAYLELQNVTKGFGGVPVLQDVCLSMERGEFVAIVGFSGAGKTTLISLIAGLLKPDSGRILCQGKEITGPGPDRGLVFQNYSLLPWLNVAENIRLAVDQVHPDWTSKERSAHVDRHIAMVNLGPARDKRPNELSGGMRQRVSVARALAMDPSLLLLDEPLSALDALTRSTLQDEISRIRAETEKTVLLITNDPDEGIYLADRIVPLTAGPGATLGPSFVVDLPRPRQRQRVSHDTHFQSLRREVTQYLLGSRQENSAAITRKLVLPDIEPEDLTLPRTSRRAPLRRSEIKRETLSIP